MESAPLGKETWQETLDAVFEGDVEQFGRLCEDYLRPKLYPFALTLLKNPDDAEDVVQGVFERLLTHYQQIRKRKLTSVEAFVMTMVKNACRDLWKTQKCTQSVSEDLSTSTTPQEEFARQELLDSLYATIQQELTETEQQIFDMKVVQGLPYRTISEQTGIPTTTTYEHYQNILLKIDKHGELREYWEEIKVK